MWDSNRKLRLQHLSLYCNNKWDTNLRRIGVLRIEDRSILLQI